MWQNRSHHIPYFADIPMEGKHIDHYAMEAGIALEILITYITNQNWTQNVDFFVLHEHFWKHATSEFHELHGINLFHSFSSGVILIQKL